MIFQVSVHAKLAKHMILGTITKCTDYADFQVPTFGGYTTVYHIMLSACATCNEGILHTVDN